MSYRLPVELTNTRTECNCIRNFTDRKIRIISEPLCVNLHPAHSGCPEPDNYDVQNQKPFSTLAASLVEYVLIYKREFDQLILVEFVKLGGETEETTH